MQENDLHNERQLLTQISEEGDEQAFATFFTHYYPQLYSVVRPFSLRDDEVQEALQEAFLQLWLQRDQLPNISNIRGWLLRIASRQCREILRKNLLLQHTTDQLTNIAPPINPSEKILVTEIKSLVQEAIGQMPDQRKRIYLLSREEGLKPSEIAERLSLSVSTVKNTLVAALKHIRDHLSESGYSLPLIFFLIFF